MRIDTSNAALDTSLSVLEISIIADLQKVAQITRLQGHACRPYSPKAIQALRALPLEKKNLSQNNCKAL